MSSLFKKFSGSTRRISIGLSLVQLFKAFLAFFTVIISSTYFGASIERDVWLISLAISGIFSALIFGPIFETFRVKFITIKENHGEKVSLKHIGSLITYIFLLTIIVVIISELMPAFLSHSFAPTYSNEQHKFLSTMIRIVMPTMLFTVITSILSGLLNSYDVFYAPEIMSIFSTIINVIIILLFAPKYGIYSLVFSNYLTNLILIVVLLFQIRKNKILLFQNLNLNFSYSVSFLRFALPFYFTYFISQGLLALERIISTLIGVGSVSIIDYARRFVSIPISVIQSTINLVLSTSLAKVFLNEGEKAFVSEINKFINLAVILVLPLITIFVICPIEIVRIFLLRGKFEIAFLNPTAQALFWFGFGIFAIIFYSTCGQGLVARGKVKIVALASSVMGFVILLMNLLLYKKFGIGVIAFSWSLLHLITGLYMYFVISKQQFKFLFKELNRKLALTTTVLTTSFIFHFFFNKLVSLDSLLFKSIIGLGVTFAFSMFIELLFIFVYDFSEKEIASKYLKKYFVKP